MNKTKYCINHDCDVMSCVHNPKNNPNPNETYRVYHLEENPLYCKKGAFNRYQVEDENDQD